MIFFIIKNVFTLNTRQKLIITGSVKSDNENWNINKSNYLLINNDIKLPIQEINEAHIKDNFYIAFTFNLDTLDTILLQDIMKFQEGYELKII